MGELPQPLPQQGVAYRSRQPVAKGLGASRVLTGQDPVVQRLIAHPPLRELPLEVLVPVQTQLGGVEKVGAELQEERTEVPIDAVHIEVIDHRGGANQPRVAHAGLPIAPPLGPKHRRLLLRLADEQHPLGLREPLEVLRRDVVLALALPERHHRNPLSFREALHLVHEPLTDGVHQRTRRKGISTMEPKETRHAPFALQLRNVDVEVHPIDALDLQGHMPLKDLSDALWYAHVGSGSTPIRRDRSPPRRPTSLARTACSSSPSTGASPSIMHHAPDSRHTSRRSEAKPR
jgi:hypothetical protein